MSTGGGDRDFAAMWTAIVEVHNESKAMFLLCEELEPRQFKTFLQPYNELRHAYEHIVRSKANELKLDSGEHDSDYQWQSLSRALGHEYRGFFDCADWLAVILRESIQDTLRPYSVASIQAVLPDYYPKDKTRIIEISETIAEIRGDKDVARKKEATEDYEVAKEPNVLEGVRRYKEVLAELQGIRKKVLRATASLDDYQRKSRREDGRKWKWSIVSSLLTAGVIAAATFCKNMIPSNLIHDRPLVDAKVQVPNDTNAGTQASTSSADTDTRTRVNQGSPNK